MPGATGEATTRGPAVAPTREPTLRLPVAVLAVLASVVVALLAVALVVRLDTDRLPTAPPRDPPAEPGATTRMTVTGRKVTFEELSVVLAGPPYACQGDVPSPLPAVDQLALCTSTVHADFDDQGSDWAATTGVALLDDSVVDAGDLKGTTASAFDAILDLSYSKADRVRLEKQSAGPATISAPTGAAYTQQADVHVDRKGLATPYDRLVVIVVRLENGRHAAFYSDFPHDGSKAALQAVVASVSTLTARR